MTLGNQTPDAPVPVEKDDGANRCSIRSDQLKHIGNKLRGLPRFSFFYKLFLPIIVSAATIVFSTLIQYISWRNSVKLENATLVATKAAESYEKVAGSIGQRIYGTFLFVPTLRSLIQAKKHSVKSNEPLADAADPLNGLGGSAATGQAFRERASIQPRLLTEVPLDRLDHDLKRIRFESYYVQLRHWNENYDQLLTEVDYALDRPIFQHAGIPSNGINVFSNKITKIDCARSLTEQLGGLGLNPDSLKLRLAGINFCFLKVHAILDGKLTKALLGTEVQWEPSLDGQFKAMLGSIKTMTNEFRCYALRRIDYYNQRREGSILSPTSFLRRMNNSESQEAHLHLQETAVQCNPENRPT